MQQNIGNLSIEWFYYHWPHFNLESRTPDNSETRNTSGTQKT